MSDLLPEEWLDSHGWGLSHHAEFGMLLIHTMLGQVADSLGGGFSVDGREAIALLDQKRVEMLGRELDAPMVGRDWWTWTISQNGVRTDMIDECAEPMTLDEVIKAVPDRLRDWLKGETLAAIQSGEASPELHAEAATRGWIEIGENDAVN